MPYEGTHSNEQDVQAIMQKRLKYWKKKAEKDKKEADNNYLDLL